jgi:hypothetical protein
VRLQSIIREGTELSKKARRVHDLPSLDNPLIANVSEQALVDLKASPVGADTREVALEGARHDGASRNRGASADDLLQVVTDVRHRTKGLSPHRLLCFGTLSR